MTQLKSDRMLEALEKLEAVKTDYWREWGDPDAHLHLAIESLKDALAQQLLTERRRAGVIEVGDMVIGGGEVRPVIVKGYNDEPLGHGGHPPADRGGSEAGCYS